MADPITAANPLQQQHPRSSHTTIATSPTNRQQQPHSSSNNNNINSSTNNCLQSHFLTPFPSSSCAVVGHQQQTQHNPSRSPSSLTHHSHRPQSGAYIRSTTPSSRYLGSCSTSPLPTPSTYALVSSARNLGTPTSDIRGTTPTPDPSQAVLNSSPLSHSPSPGASSTPSSSSSASAQPFREPRQAVSQQSDWYQQPRSGVEETHDLFSQLVQQHSHLRQPDQQPSCPPLFDPPLPPHPPQSASSPEHPVDLPDFWAILDNQLGFVYVDPGLQTRLSLVSSNLCEIQQTSVYEWMRPSEAEELRSEIGACTHGSSLASELLLIPAEPSAGQGTHQPGSSEHGPGHSPTFSAALRQRSSSLLSIQQLFARPQSKPFPRSRPSSAEIDWILGDRNPLVIGTCLSRPERINKLTSRSSSSSQASDEFIPAHLFLHPIGHTHLLGFFHYAPEANAARETNQPAAAPVPPNYEFEHQQANILELALDRSGPSLLNPSLDQIRNRDNHHPPPPPPNIFLILNSYTGHVVFSYPPPPPPSSSPSIPPHTPPAYYYRPEDYAYLALQSKSLDPTSPDRPGRDSTHRQILVDGSIVNVDQSFVIQYGKLIFAGFRSSPSSPPPPPQPHTESALSFGSQARSDQSPHLHPSRPSPLDLSRDKPTSSSELYSPTSIRPPPSRSHKRSRADSCSDVPLTPQSATSTHHSSAYSHPHYPRPASHISYPAYPPHHHQSHRNPPQTPSGVSAGAQLSPLVSNIPMPPESPDTYGSQYTHFSGELSPTMASAANVLGSFQRAHYHHPQSILALQDLAHHHHGHHAPQLSPAPNSAISTHSSILMGGNAHYDHNYALESLANMAVGNGLPNDFSPVSSRSSPHANSHGVVGEVGGAERMIRVGSGAASMFADYPRETGMRGGSSPTGGRGIERGQQTPRMMSQARKTIVTIGAGESGERRCTSCGVANSPEWRKGPNGVKSLCNACGLRYSRAQARKTKVKQTGSSGGATKKKNVGTTIGSSNSLVGAAAKAIGGFEKGMMVVASGGIGGVSAAAGSGAKDTRPTV